MEAVYPGEASYGARFTNRPSPLPEGLAYQHRSGVQRVAAVVARPDEQEHPASVGRPEQVEDRVRQAVGRALHQGVLRQAGEQSGLGLADLVGGVRSHHGLHASGAWVPERGTVGQRARTLTVRVVAPVTDSEPDTARR